MKDTWRTTETRHAVTTAIGLAVYAVLETVASWQMFGGAKALIHPGYLHSLTGMGLLFAGAFHSLRARPRPAPGLMCASHAWYAATFWRAATLRINIAEGGSQLFYGSPELWVTIGAAGVVIAMFAVSLVLTYHAESATHGGSRPVSS